MSRIFVTGMGAISAIGNSVAGNRAALIEGRTGIGPLRQFNTRYADLLPFGEVGISTASLADKLSAHEPGLTRTSLLALHAFEEAVADAGWDEAIVQSSDTALIGANTVGGMCLTDELYRDANSREAGSPYLASYDAASVNLYLQKRFGLTGIINTINTACSSSANAIAYGARLIQHGFAKRAIVGGTDSLAKFTINGFNALHILSAKPCAPFDQDRNGLNLGEGAAFIILENETALKERKTYAILSGHANSNDAFHPSSISDEGEGPYRSMKGALELAALRPGDISFINAHGTGTENNDLTESRAMLRLFEKVPPFASTKSNTGHTLGAAGALEAVFSILNLYHQEIYPAQNWQQPIPETGLRPVHAYQQLPLQHVMSNSFGFGGNCTSLVFSAC